MVGAVGHKACTASQHVHITMVEGSLHLSALGSGEHPMADLLQRKEAEHEDCSLDSEDASDLEQQHWESDMSCKRRGQVSTAIPVW